MRRDGSCWGGAPSISKAPRQGQTGKKLKYSMCVTVRAHLCVQFSLLTEEERRLILAQVKEKGRRAEDGLDEMKLESMAENKKQRQEDSLSSWA